MLPGDAFKCGLGNFQQDAGFGTDRGRNAGTAAETRGMAKNGAGLGMTDQDFAVAGGFAIGVEQPVDDNEKAATLIAFGLRPFAGVEPRQPPIGQKRLCQFGG